MDQTMKQIIQNNTREVFDKMMNIEIEVKEAAARETLEGEISDFSNELAEKILGRSVQ